MRLLIVSHTPHYLRGGKPVGWGATVREIDHLSRLFKSVCHIAPVHDEPPPESAIPYESPSVRLRVVAPAGGRNLRQKFSILPQLPAYARAIREELQRADVVHVRCPANIALWALAVLRVEDWRGPLWIKYAGSWKAYGKEPWSYKIQRTWLRHGWRGAVVTVNGRWESQPAHVRSFYNPCLTAEEIAEAKRLTSQKRLSLPVRLLFVGRLDQDKGAPQFLEIVRTLLANHVAVEADVVGDGPDRDLFETRSREDGFAQPIRLHGWLPRTAINRLYADAHFIVLPSRAEGWPKVLSEAMAHGTVPLASRAGSIPQYLSDFGAGQSLAEQKDYVDTIVEYLSKPEQWQVESNNAMKAAEWFSYEAYLDALRANLMPTASRIDGAVPVAMAVDAEQ